MIKVGTFLPVADNSGAREVLCIRILGSKKSAKVGDVIVVSTKKCLPKGKVKSGTVQRAVIIRIKKAAKIGGDSMISADDNAVVLINKQNELIGTRIFGPTDNALRHKGFIKIISLSQEVLQ